MARFFIERPRFAWVVAIFITLSGLLSLPFLPVSQFPEVSPPQISIWINYPGASASAVVENVTSVIEEELNGAKNLLYFESSSNTNIGEITVTFEPGTDPELAQVDVQNRIKKAESRLPLAVLQQGLKIEQANSGFLMIYALLYNDNNAGKSDVMLADFAARNVNNEIRRIPGVGKVQFFSAEAAMRIWLDPQKLITYGISVADVNNEISKQNVQVPAGSFGSRPSHKDQELTATINVKGMLSTPEEFGKIILRGNPDGSQVHLADVARIEIGPQDYSFATQVNGKRAVSAAVQLSPGANALETATAVKKRLEELSATFPEGMDYTVPYDTSIFVGVAITKVLKTLLEAVVLVFLVMLLFLQNIRYTLVPTIVVPVCLAGTLAVMALLGFSVNMMTMFGMVLAIGILVDDAIVVVENVERIMDEEGLPPTKATLKAMDQVSGAIVGITLVLAAVFLPLGFMGGAVGIIYQQFSISLAVSILFSGFLALTFTPALCATLLRPVDKSHEQNQKGFFSWFNRRFTRLTERFDALNSILLRKVGRYMIIYFVLIFILGFCYLRLPESFVPVEDQGYYLVDIQLPPGAAFERTQTVVKDLEQYMDERKNIDNTTMIMGYSFSGNGPNAALAFPTLKDWSKREESTSDEVEQFNENFANYTDASLLAMDPPAISGLGNSGGFSLRLQDKGNLGREALLKAKNILLDKANAHPAIAYASVEGLEDAPQISVKIDREKARTLGVSFETINNALTTAFGSSIPADFANKGRLQRVVVQADGEFRSSPDNVLSLRVPNSSGQMVPLSTIASIAWEKGPIQLSRYNGYPAFKISGDAANGYTSGQAMRVMEEIALSLQPGISYEWTGLSYQEQVAGGQASTLLTLSVLVVFLLLVALYESWKIPFSVMLIVPIGVLGSVLAAFVFDMPNDVYFKVGLVTIIGLATKNAILIIEFANGLRKEGISLISAVSKAARLRFRPIIMTSMAFILGVLPLTFASGAGSASQKAIGIGVVGGMLAATLLGVIFVPLFYVWVLRFGSKFK
ncbi:multidrug efflux RND transporter permease subunit [Serratia ureilytica]|uniref:multidrug efflux RND transporter permease subunit n=1 Tax=Serratia ureilytica TaxID=300181 RepID=UPI00313C51B8